MIQIPTLDDIIENSNNNIGPSNKRQVFNILCDMRGKGGACIVLSSEEDIISYSNKKYLSQMDEDLFYKSPLSLYSSKAQESIRQCLDYDGAIIVAAHPDDAVAVHSGMYLRADPIDVLEEMGIENHRDMSARMGFCKSMGTRHCTAKAASYRMSDSTIFVLSEEYCSIRMFEKGRTVYSPFTDEIEGYIIAA